MRFVRPGGYRHLLVQRRSVSDETSQTLGTRPVCALKNVYRPWVCLDNSVFPYHACMVRRVGSPARRAFVHSACVAIFEPFPLRLNTHRPARRIVRLASDYTPGYLLVFVPCTQSGHTVRLSPAMSTFDGRGQRGVKDSNDRRGLYESASSVFVLFYVVTYTAFAHARSHKCFELP